MKFLFSAMEFQYTSLKEKFTAYFQAHAHIFYGKLRRFKQFSYRYGPVEQNIIHAKAEYWISFYISISTIISTPFVILIYFN